MTDCRIYVASLSDYNAGRLHGIWIEDCTDADAMAEQIAAMLRDSKWPNVMVEHPETGEQVPSAEEYAIHDHEGFARLVGEFTQLETVAELATAIEEHGAPFIAYMENDGSLIDDIDGAVKSFEEAFRGVYDSERAFAEEYVDDMGLLAAEGGDRVAILARYFDYDAYARDLFIDSFWRDDDSGAVFYR